MFESQPPGETEAGRSRDSGPGPSEPHLRRSPVPGPVVPKHAASETGPAGLGDRRGAAETSPRDRRPVPETGLQLSRPAGPVSETAETGLGDRRDRETEPETERQPRTGFRSPVPGPGETGLGDRRDRGTGRSGTGLLLLALTAVVTVYAGIGQLASARAKQATDMIVINGWDLTPWGAPVVLDLSVAVLFGLGMNFARRNRSPWLPWCSAFALGGYSTWINYDHRGGQIFGTASAVLMIIYFLTLWGKYNDLEITAQRRAGARPKFLTSALVLAGPRIAYLAWLVAVLKPLTAVVETRAAAGEKVTERDLAIRGAYLRRDVYADAVSRLQRDRPELSWWARRRVARLTAWDTVDRMLGLSVIQRDVVLAEVTYRQSEPQPLLAPPPAADAIPDSVDDLPEDMRLPAPRPATVASQKKSPGYLELDMNVVRVLVRELNIPPQVSDDPELVLRMGKDMPYVKQITSHFDGKDGREHWHRRRARIGKSDVTAATGVTGSRTTNRVAQLFDALRQLPHHPDGS